MDNAIEIVAVRSVSQWRGFCGAAGKVRAAQPLTTAAVSTAQPRLDRRGSCAYCFVSNVSERVLVSALCSWALGEKVTRKKSMMWLKCSF